MPLVANLGVMIKESSPTLEVLVHVTRLASLSYAERPILRAQGFAIRLFQCCEIRHVFTPDYETDTCPKRSKKGYRRNRRHVELGMTAGAPWTPVRLHRSAPFRDPLCTSDTRQQPHLHPVGDSAPETGPPQPSPSTISYASAATVAMSSVAMRARYGHTWSGCIADKWFRSMAPLGSCVTGREAGKS